MGMHMAILIPIATNIHNKLQNLSKLSTRKHKINQGTRAHRINQAREDTNMNIKIVAWKERYL